VVEHSARFNKRDVIDLGLWWCRRGDLNVHSSTVLSIILAEGVRAMSAHANRKTRHRHFVPRCLKRTPASLDERGPHRAND
jgi:hypothetical protein